MKILISDFDGTLLDRKFKENIQFVQDFVAKGNLFVLATGRNITSLKKVISAYNIPFSYIIQNDGSIILNSHFQEIYRCDLDRKLSKELFYRLEASQLFESVFYDTGYTYQKEISNYHNRIIGKIQDRELANIFLQELQRCYGRSIYAYLSNNWINITSGINNKVMAIEWLKKKNKWSSEDIYTVGDDINDLLMLTTYHGYVVGNKLNSANVFKIASFLELKKIL